MEEKLVFTTEEKDTTEGLLSKLLANDANGFQTDDAISLHRQFESR